MVTNQTNWDNKPQVQKGNIGEEIVRKEYFEKRGFVVYKPITDGPHPFDMLAVKDKKILAIAEVKTKPRRKYYADTGFNYQHYLEYKSIVEKYKLELFVFFVDEYLKEVYGNNFSNLVQKTFVNCFDYPKREGNIIYFPLDNMIKVAVLTDEQVAQIGKYNSSNYDYKAEDKPSDT